MTDPTTNESEAAERIRRLQERRTASSPKARVRPAAATPTGGTPTAGATRKAAPSRRTRRPHPAAATRWLLGGLSLASFFGIGGAVAAANLNSVATASSGTTATAAAPTTPVATVTPATPRATNATSVATKAPVVAHSTTRGS